MRDFVFDNVRIRTSDHWSDISFWFMRSDDGMKPRVLAPNEEEYMEILLYPNKPTSDIDELHSLLNEESSRLGYPSQKFDSVQNDFWVAASFKDEAKERFHRIWCLYSKNTTVCLIFHGELEHYNNWLKECDEIVQGINIE
jgi:hypothetical protein